MMTDTSTNKLQILYIHGGMTFKTRDDYLHFLRTREISLVDKRKWNKKYLSDAVGEYFYIINVRMPLQEDAKYEEWKITFERYIPFLNENVILIGTSLGGIFLAKYLSEHTFPKKILSVYLICPPFDDSLSTEDLVGGFELQDDLSNITKNCQHTTLMFSKDDDVVPVAHAELYRRKLPDAKIIIYESKNGHFFIDEFPEIVEMIKADYNRANNNE